MTELWQEKYRPKYMSEYVFVDENQKNQFLKWIEQKNLPHIIFSGSPGVGKTTAAKMLFNELGVEPGDILYINASKERGIDTIRDKIDRFASTMPLGDIKYIHLDEADFLTRDAQAALRSPIEENSKYTRFILTCNFPEKIIEALHSRLVGIHITKLNEEQFIKRIIEILDKENVEYDNDVLQTYITATYPDLRSCIKACQTNTINGKLELPSKSQSISDDYIIQVVALFKEKRYQEARKLICSTCRKNDYPEIFKLLYNNLDWWSDDEHMQKQVLIKIAQGLRWHEMVADPEINFSSTLCELELLINPEGTK